MKAMLQLLANPSSLGRVVPPTTTSVTAVPTFAPFDSTSELWKDCSSRFLTFTRAHSVPDDRKAQVFLTNQSLTVCIIRFQILPHKKRYRGKSTILHWIRLWLHEGAIGSDAERFKFWTTMQRQPGDPFSRAGYTHTSRSGHVRFCFHCRPLGRSITYALHLLGEQ